ncbi:MAG TPA: hypothetical protein VFY23_16290 [Candidatus Limnocylindrales bacterium]|nr:hypothetical protein [Candidatus Limnocylindrales bacterium]
MHDDDRTDEIDPRAGRAAEDQPAPHAPPTGHMAPPAPDGPPPPPSPGGQPFAPPAPPQAPPSAAGWSPQGPAPAWPQPVAVRPALDVGLIVGRTFDTLGREWSLFLALAVPAGLSGFASAVLSPSLQAIIRDPAGAAGPDQLLFLVAQVLIALLSGVTAIATIVAADAYWRGDAIGLAEAVGRGLRLLPRAIGFLLLGILLVIGLTLVLVLPLFAMSLLGSGGMALAIILLLVALVVLAWIGARLAVLFPVLVLEPTPVLGVLGRTWALTRGSAVLLFITALVIGLCGLLPSWGGSLFSLFVDDRFVAGIATGLASMVVAPLSGIWTVLAWGQLTGAPHRDTDVMTTGRGRWVALVLIVGVGMVLVLAGGALAAAGSDELRRVTEGI